MLWRISTNLRLEASQRFSDGTYLAQVYDHADRRRERGMTVRVIEYVLDDPGRPGDMRYRLLTNILEPARAPAPELAALYAQRWEFETTLDDCLVRPKAHGDFGGKRTTVSIQKARSFRSESARLELSSRGA